MWTASFVHYQTRLGLLLVPEGYNFSNLLPWNQLNRDSIFDCGILATVSTELTYVGFACPQRAQLLGDIKRWMGKPETSYKTTLKFPLRLNPSWTYADEGSSVKTKENTGWM